jgi:hypothetical protein
MNASPKSKLLYRLAHLEESREYHKRYYQENKARILVGMTVRLRESRHRHRKLALIKLGDKCARCGFDDVRALQIDHVNGGGCKERGRTRNNKFGSGTRIAFYKKVINDTEGLYQCLCANCNWIKRSENKEYPKGYTRIRP